MRHPAAALALSLLLLASTPAVAASAGGPVAGAPAGGDGVVAPGGTSRFVTVAAGGRSTVLRISTADGRVERSRTLAGRYMVAAAAGDATGTGLSADGSTLVLAPPRNRFPVARSRFTVLDARTLRPERSIALRGDFTLDAISPDGRLLYLVQYTSPRDVTKYVVRAFDMNRSRLLRDPVVDPDEAGEPMRGMPLARSQSADGRWAYTLYDGNGSHPFVHALDTQAAKAVCVDLDQLAGRDDLWGMTLRTEPSGAVTVVGETGPELTIDPRSFAVRSTVLEAAGAERTARRPHGSSGDGGIAPWGVAGILASLALLLAGGALARRGRPGVGSV